MGASRGDSSGTLVFPLAGLALLTGVAISIVEGGVLHFIGIGCAILVLFKVAAAMTRSPARR